MKIRQAQPRDRPAIRDVARRSLQASYPLGPKTITGAIEEWYEEDRLSERLADEDQLLLVADVDGQVVGFCESTITGEDTGELLWLHVDPDYRAEDYGEPLFEATRDRLADRGVATLQSRVLADNHEGNAFYEQQGLSKVGETEVEIDGDPYVENVYAETEHEDVESIELDDGTVYVHHEATERGSLSAFHLVYTTRDADKLYGYWCSKCGTLANAMDAMGRIRCDVCGNARKPTRWDAAYL
jgi:ribosomal protein S18 acetylase RimI-like enzyme